MDVAHSKDGDIVIVTISGSLDNEAKDEFLGLVNTWIAQKEKFFVMDVSPCKYMNSAALRNFVILGKTAKAQGGRLCFAGVKGMLKEVFDINNLSAVFPVYADVEEARQSF